MSDHARQAELFRALHIRGRPLVLFNIWDAGAARVVTAGGARAIATSSWSVAAANGFADGERMPLSLAMDSLRRIVCATNLPVTVDLESGYGETPDAVGETIDVAIDAGAVGCNLEDGMPANSRVREVVDQVERIRCARLAADATSPGFFINARTDLFLQRASGHHDDALVAQATERARAYADAGADGLFVPGVSDIALIVRLVESSPLPVNIMVDSATPPVCVLAAHGVARVSHGPRPYMTAMHALEAAARAAYDDLSITQ